MNSSAAFPEQDPLKANPPGNDPTASIAADSREYEEPDYEQPASFYLGKRFELANRVLTEEKILYDAKDLTTHAMCVGMTGSGKTGLCLAMLEEAALDGIPAICIDPKGDLGNLLLAFPNLAAEDFRPWLEASEGARKGLGLDEYAAKVATQWREGLAGWQQAPERIRRYREAVDINIFTPASSAGIPLTVLKNFEAPPREVVEDGELMRERVSGAASGLLTLLGISADPLTSREHILLSTILDTAWRRGEDLDLAGLIRYIQVPPVDKIGVFDMESYFSRGDRTKFAMGINNLLASPTFAGWLEGEPLDIRRLLYTANGKPRLSIISIAHLNDSERMFFVTMFLNELLSWMRTQPGTTTLRALFYMDEVYGYFPPSAKPPSKTPMMILLKQARAFGLGIVLATQNPVDLDYKGLSNIGTWFLGRLQTARDKDRVLEGLEGAAAQTGSKFNRGAMEQTLAALGSRVFLMNNVHDDGPTIFQTRWVMSYLRGPLSRDQIVTLMKDRRGTAEAAGSEQAANAGAALSPAVAPPSPAQTARPQAPAGAAAKPAEYRPIVPPEIEQKYCLPLKRLAAGSKLVYRPALYAEVAVHYVRATYNVDSWIDKRLIVPAWRSLQRDVWTQCEPLSDCIEVSKQPDEDGAYDEPPSEMLNGKNYKAWSKDLVDYLFRHAPLTLYNCAELKAVSMPGQDELDARLGWELLLRERRDAAKEELQAKYARLQNSLQAKIAAAEQRLAREKAQYDSKKFQSAMDVGQTVIGWLVGKKLSRRSTTTGLGRTLQHSAGVANASETLNALLAERRALIDECEREVDGLKERFCIHALKVEQVEIPCRKGDLQVKFVALLWVPFEVDSEGKQTSLIGDI
jgi:hypothetical protein